MIDVLWVYWTIIDIDRSLSTYRYCFAFLRAAGALGCSHARFFYRSYICLGRHTHIFCGHSIKAF